jgi:ABC-type enterobactin transport system permease subunit
MELTPELEMAMGEAADAVVETIYKNGLTDELRLLVLGTVCGTICATNHWTMHQMSIVGAAAAGVIDGSVLNDNDPKDPG